MYFISKLNQVTLTKTSEVKGLFILNISTDLNIQLYFNEIVSCIRVTPGNVSTTSLVRSLNVGDRGGNTTSVVGTGIAEKKRDRVSKYEKGVTKH